MWTVTNVCTYLGEWRLKKEYSARPQFFPECLSPPPAPAPRCFFVVFSLFSPYCFSLTAPLSYFFNFLFKRIKGYGDSLTINKVFENVPEDPWGRTTFHNLATHLSQIPLSFLRSCKIKYWSNQNIQSQIVYCRNNTGSNSILWNHKITISEPSL